VAVRFTIEYRVRRNGLMDSPADKEPKQDRRQFLSFGLQAAAYVAPVVVTLGVPALLPDQAERGEAAPGMMMRMMMMRMMMMG